MMSVACCTSARNRASLSPSTTRAWFDSSTSRVMRQATATAATPVIAARTNAVLDPESSRSTTPGDGEERGAEHDHAGASVADEPHVGASPRVRASTGA